MISLKMSFLRVQRIADKTVEKAPFDLSQHCYLRRPNLGYPVTSPRLPAEEMGETDQGADYDHLILFPDDGSWWRAWVWESVRHGFKPKLDCFPTP